MCSSDLAVTNMSSAFSFTSAFKYSIANWNFTAATSLGSILSNTGFNAVQASRVIIDLCNNATFTSKNIGSFVSYLNNTRTSTAFSRLTTAPRSNTISATAVTPVLSTFKSSGYLPSDLVYIGYGLSDLRTANYTITDLSNSNIVSTPADLKTAGYTAKDFKDIGYTLNQLVSLGYTAIEIRAAGFTPDQVLSLGYTLDSLFQSGIYDYSELVP